MRLLLDTAVMIFALESPDRFSSCAASALSDPVNNLELSSVSLAEMAIKARLGKLNVSLFTVRDALDSLAIRVLPFAADHAFELFSLPMHHRDPFDQQIIAQALAEHIAVITPDRAFHLYKDLKVIW